MYILYSSQLRVISLISKLCLHQCPLFLCSRSYRLATVPEIPRTVIEVKVTLRLTVSQYVLVSSTLVGLATRYYFLSECCCLKFEVLYRLGALSDERTGLQFAV
jgi:hypothetical protein